MTKEQLRRLYPDFKYELVVKRVPHSSPPLYLEIGRWLTETVGSNGDRWVWQTMAHPDSLVYWFKDEHDCSWARQRICNPSQRQTHLTTRQKRQSTISWGVRAASSDELKSLSSVAIHDPLNTNWAAMYAWLAQVVGDYNYASACSKFYFRYERDAVLFALRWL